MLSTYSIENLIGLQDVEIKNIESGDSTIEIELYMAKKAQKCPACGCETSQIHDYRTQNVKDAEAFGKSVTLKFHKRRYRCSCGKRFAEENSFLARYYRMTHRLIMQVLNKLREVRSFTDVALESNLSTSTVIRIFDMVSYPAADPGEVIAIDEFKGNTGGQKYQCIITDPQNRVVLDILPMRYDHYLTSYFKNMPREHVKYFVSDMWKPYAALADVYFKNAVQIVDKYHWVRQVIWAFEAVRKEEQKKFSKERRKYFKRSKLLLTKRFDQLRDEDKQAVNIMLYASMELATAHALKESFLKILKCSDITSAKKNMSQWIMMAQASKLVSFVRCAATMVNWSRGIINSLEHPYTNGFTEGCNNKIKVLKRNAYGYTNFKRFRNRILHIFAHQRQKERIHA